MCSSQVFRRLLLCWQVRSWRSSFFPGPALSCIPSALTSAPHHPLFFSINLFSLLPPFPPCITTRLSLLPLQCPAMGSLISYSWESSTWVFIIWSDSSINYSLSRPSSVFCPGSFPISGSPPTSGRPAGLSPTPTLARFNRIYLFDLILLFLYTFYHFSKIGLTFLVLTFLSFYPPQPPPGLHGADLQHSLLRRPVHRPQPDAEQEEGRHGSYDYSGP